ncbi:N-methylhydantoinase B [Sphingobium faniae]|nr:N-methylhydantoinase B [Sphingobium faniae]
MPANGEATQGNAPKPWRSPPEMDADWLPDEPWDGVSLGYVPRSTHMPLRAPPMFEGRETPDPVTYQVLRWKLWTINLEHSDTIKRVSGSPAIVYMDDFATSILTAEGDNVVTGPTIQYFTGLADLIVKWTIEHRSDAPGIRDGDTFLQNDPYIGAAHQIDTALYMPLFWEGKIICWLFNAAHQGDLGGQSPGSFCAGARDIFDEPTPVPPVRIARDGLLQEDIAALFTRKSRTPDLVALQLRSQIAGLNMARRRIMDLLNRYGPAILAGTMDRMIADCAAKVAERLEKIPDGRFSEVIDIAGLTPSDQDVHRYRLEIRKQGSTLICTNAGTDEQFGPGNCTYAAWRSAIVCAASSILGHDQLSCPAGVLTHLRFEPLPGRLTCARYPGAVTTIISTTVSVNLANLVLGKMVLPGPRDIAETAIGSGAGAILNTWVLDAVDRKGRRITDVTGDGIAGGFGASRYRDGIDNGGAWFMPGNVAGDAEEWEQSLPMLYLYRRENIDSGGAGRMRGGNGLATALCGHKTDHCQVLTLNVDTSLNATPGQAGGMPGHCGDFSYRADSGIIERLEEGAAPANRRHLQKLVGDVARLRPMAAVRLLPQDVLTVQVCAGGGFGDPLEREPEQVARDVADHSVSPAAAKDIYGVVLHDGAVDMAATDDHRRDIRAKRLARADAPARRPSERRSVPADASARHVADALALHGTGDRAHWHCDHCGHVLGPVGDNHKLFAAVLRRDMSEFDPALYPPPSEIGKVRFELRHYLCPECATVLSTNFCRCDEDHREDIMIVPASLKEMSA